MLIIVIQSLYHYLKFKISLRSYRVASSKDICELIDFGINIVCRHDANENQMNRKFHASLILTNICNIDTNAV